MKNLTFNKKILLIIIFSIGFSVLFSFLFIHYLYSKLYVSSIEDSIVHQGKRTASHYHYGELSDEIIEKIQWYNVVSEYEIIVVDELDELYSYFPYKINYENLIDSHDQSELEQGKYVMKEGFVEELHREILGAIFPIKGDQGLIGFIYIYVPLEAIQDVFSDSIPILLVVGTLFFCIFFLIITRVWKSIFKPLQDLQRLSDEVSTGNYSNTIQTDRQDEIGQLIKAFNQMCLSLGQLEERKKEFTSNIVHELRTPLTYIGGYTEALKQKIYTSPEEATNYLTTIQKETERLSKLINDLVDLDYLQENSYSTDMQPIAIAQLLLDAIDLFEIHIKEKKIHLTLDMEEDLIVLGDSQRIHQVFYNIIDNAIKYSLPSGTISIKLKKVNKAVQLQINNDGTVIPTEDIDRIGERFFRTDKARNRTTGGTGLGLSIVKEIVRLHKGNFTITSDQSTGTTVTIQLPYLDIEGVER
ncbi:sensor histidine kinase [Gracilibacillus alcaliphilus]|uniref:sensor histidine kinase n=1 Tax=Gracilibacillus alcaliphilus TaxID=1401441 RepID=UPI001958EA57|nr:HAMP domain-containing sensor histidine kinase [Gracilibacillus alcaliphilus]MBM7678279.1 signal transduction histidine kinase [Gracilibacillus alcaliphilus]